jgi:two-component system, OmpR family, KDP operon response regulator KdpE
VSTVLIVDDETPLLRTLGESLRRVGYGVTFATTGGQAVAQVLRHPADAIILDLGLPDISGMEVLSRVRRWTTVPVIVLSGRTAEIQKVAALDAGANDYITKPFGMSEFLARLRVALRDAHRGPDEPVVQTEHFTIDLAAQRVLRGGRAVPLTRTEWQIVQLLARNPGRLVSQREMLSEIWGLKDTIANNYVRVFMVTIRRKLEPDPGHPRYFITEPGSGVRFLPSGEVQARQPGPGAGLGQAGMAAIRPAAGLAVMASRGDGSVAGRDAPENRQGPERDQRRQRVHAAVRGDGG